MNEMRRLIPFLALVSFLGACRTAGPGSVEVSPGADLRRVVERSSGPVRYELQPGTYRLEPVEWTDPTCGNCEDPATPIPVTLGVRLSGDRIEIVGSSAEDVVIETGAGYGILFDGCHGCRLEGVTVTGGVRDPDSRATDAAIIARESSVVIDGVVVRDNIGEPEIVRETVVGIIGIAGRERARLEIRNSRIIRNSWDGIALYRDARATITDNVVDGVDKARGKEVGGGRGVGIGITWNAIATVERNLVTRYWKGIGTFVDASSVVRENVVEDVITWGITLWDAGKGDAGSLIEDNLVYRVGACGISVTRRADCGTSDRCGVRGNALLLTGLNEKYDAPDYYCAQEALAVEEAPADFAFGDNLFFMNREPDSTGRRDMAVDRLDEEIASLLDRLEGDPSLAESVALRVLRSGVGQDRTPP